MSQRCQIRLTTDQMHGEKRKDQKLFYWIFLFLLYFEAFVYQEMSKLAYCLQSQDSVRRCVLFWSRFQLHFCLLSEKFFVFIFVSICVCVCWQWCLPFRLAKSKTFCIHFRLPRQFSGTHFRKDVNEGDTKLDIFKKFFFFCFFRYFFFVNLHQQSKRTRQQNS